MRVIYPERSVPDCAALHPGYGCWLDCPICGVTAVRFRLRGAADPYYDDRMTKLLRDTLKQVEQLPDAEQDAAAGALLDYLAHRSDLRLTDEQLAEIRRRRADPNRTLVSHEQARARVGRFGA